jgi:energy-coupling factor transport system substrate-specific component
VSWSAAAFLILGLALAAGFGWYERSRPDARVIALVACLAAFAALGRIAFAAVPNVKPTTDIVLVSGFALGGAPGFAVGALAGLSSNFFFGQGPWTPWQMAAWGITGIVGALLALVSARRHRFDPPHIGRLTLAVVCGLVGFAFTVVQDVGDWVTYSDHSLAQLGAYVGQGLGFDAIHAIGCVVFALAMGPALIRSIQRFSRRLDVRWVAPGAAFPPLLLVVVALAGLGGASGLPGTARASSYGPVTPAGYLLGAENADGGFGAAPGQPSGGLFTGWAALGLAAAGHNPRVLARDGHGLIGYVRRSASGSLDTGSLERTILVIRAAGLSAQSFAGRDLVSVLEGRLRSGGSVAGQVNLTAFAVLALRAAGVTPPAATVAWLARQQNADGGFGFAARGTASDVDDTGAVLEALSGQNGLGTVRHRAVSYIRGRQDRDGGLPSQPGLGSNAQSTAWAIQGLEAAGVNASGLHRRGAVSPLHYLRSLITPGGSVDYARGQSQTPVWVTGEALMALDGKPLPLATLPAPAHARRRPARVASSRATVPAKAGRQVGKPRRRRHRPGAPSAPVAAISTGGMLRLSAGAGVVVALLLAPVGLG